MPELPEVTQKFLADTAPYIAALQAAIAEAEKLAAANRLLVQSMEEVAAATAAAASGEHGIADESSLLAGILVELRNNTETVTAGFVAMSAAIAASQAEIVRAMGASTAATEAWSKEQMAAAARAAAASQAAATRAQELADAYKEMAAEVAAATGVTGDTFDKLKWDMLTTAAAAGTASALSREAMDNWKSSVAGLADTISKADTLISQSGAIAHAYQLGMLDDAAATKLLDNRISLMQKSMGTAAGDMQNMSNATKTAGNTAATAGGMFGLTGKQLHWLVMGSVEVAATAVPAMIAFGAAMIGMSHTFIDIYHQMDNLYTASGSLSGALRNSVGPMQQLGAASATTAAKLAPDAYTIFGSIINTVTRHVGAFSNMAQQAGNVLAQFATKLSGELAGGMGASILKFFKSGVSDMTQWGQVIGNIGHTFLNVVTNMLGVGKVLLFVIDALSKAFELLSANPVIGTLIGVAAAMSAVYRYAILLRDIWKWLGGSALVNAIKGIATWFVTLAQDMKLAAFATGEEDAAMVVLNAEIGLLMKSLGPLLIALGVVAGIVLLYAAASAKSTDATTRMITAMEHGSQAASVLAADMNKLMGHLDTLLPAYTKIVSSQQRVAQSTFGIGAAYGNTTSDVADIISALKKFGAELNNQVTGLVEAGQRTGQLGADMNALTIAGSSAMKTVQSVNQAIDQYIGILTGGTAAQAQFVTSLHQIGSVAGRTANNIGTASSIQLGVKQFTAALQTMNARGASAWTNLDQVMGSSLPQLLDWFRQAEALGAASGTTFQQAALDAASGLVKWIGTNRVAQDQLLGLMRAEGLNVRTWHDLTQAIHLTHSTLSALSGPVGKTTIALSNFGKMAQNAANDVNSLATQAIAQATFQYSGFTGQIDAAAKALAAGQPYSAVKKHLDAARQDLQQVTREAAMMGQGVTSGAGRASSGVRLAAQIITGALGLAGKAATRFTDWWIADTHRTVRQIQMEAQAVRMLQAYINSLHGKTITVHTLFTSGGARPTMGTSGGTLVGFHGGVVPGFQSGGVMGGTGGYDRNMAMLSAGEGILTSAATRAAGGPMAIQAMNQRPTELLGGGMGGGGTGTINLHLTIPVMVDGQAIQTSQRAETLTYNRRNSSNNLGLRVR